VSVEIIALRGLPEIGPGDDLAGMIAGCLRLEDGDVVVVTQKAVSKAEGRLVGIDPTEREAERARWARREARRIVARRGDLVIAETRHGFVCANAGVDGSNVPADRLALLPADPDGSAGRLRKALSAHARVAVVVSDTFGRPWRVGQTNVAIGVAGMAPIRDHVGEKDAHGNVLQATEIAVADEIAAAAELVMGKVDGVPMAVLRGLDAAGEGSARALVRPPGDDMFRTGPIEALEARRSVRAFTEREVPAAAIERAAEAAATAPAPHHSRPWRFVWLRSAGARRDYLGALAEAWRADLAADGAAPEVIARRLARSDEVLGAAPVLVAVFVSTLAADGYPDERRARAERDMFVASTGAAIQNFMVALAAHGVGSCWLSSSLFCPVVASRALGLGEGWHALGSVAAGYPEAEPPPRARHDAPVLEIR
jgi:coenzyme F420-0:L-glutamate ligase/coenzyme F420-1:gamma-L-glutamate ligase